MPPDVRRWLRLAESNDLSFWAQPSVRAVRLAWISSDVVKGRARTSGSAGNELLDNGEAKPSPHIERQSRAECCSNTKSCKHDGQRTPRPRVSASPCLRVPASPCPRVSPSPRPGFAPFPILVCALYSVTPFPWKRALLHRR